MVNQSENLVKHLVLKTSTRFCLPFIGRVVVDARVWEPGKTESVQVDAFGRLYFLLSRLTKGEDLAVVHLLKLFGISRPGVCWDCISDGLPNYSEVAVVGLGGMGSLAFQQLFYVQPVFLL